MSSLGYDVPLYKLAVFTFAGAVAGYAGALACQQTKYFSPDGMSFDVSAVAVVVIVIGGQRTLVGGGPRRGLLLRHARPALRRALVALAARPRRRLRARRRTCCRAGSSAGGRRLRAEARAMTRGARARGRRPPLRASCAPSTRSRSTVEAGSRHALIGPNGAGKSTLFHLISGTVRATSGRIRFLGTDVTRRGAAPADAARHGPHVPALEPLRRAAPRARTSRSRRSGSSATRGNPRAPDGPLPRRRRRARRSCSSSSAWPTSATSTPARCRTATAASSRSRSRSRRSRGCCCSTSRRPGCRATRRSSSWA